MQLSTKWNVQLRLLLPPDRQTAVYTLQSPTDFPGQSLALIPHSNTLLHSSSDGQALVDEVLCGQMKPYLTQRQSARVEGSVLRLGTAGGNTAAIDPQSATVSDENGMILKIGNVAIGSTYRAILLMVLIVLCINLI
jgi:hypothetical protein